MEVVNELFDSVLRSYKKLSSRWIKRRLGVWMKEQSQIAGVH
jgi:hypothetical protein